MPGKGARRVEAIPHAPPPEGNPVPLERLAVCAGTGIPPLEVSDRQRIKQLPSTERVSRWAAQLPTSTSQNRSCVNHVSTWPALHLATWQATACQSATLGAGRR